jgi:hypothetical protein
MQTLFDVSPSVHRAANPVRRHSRARGREGLFWQRFDRRQLSRYITAAERFDRVTRQRGQRKGPLGQIGLEVWRELLRMIDYRTGRLDPCIKTLADRTRRSASAVVIALKALRTHGFLDWLRRYVDTGNEGRGPQVRQISNAYRLALPPRALALLGHLATDPPPPDDAVQAREDREEARRAMVRSLSRAEQIRATFPDSPLADALAALGHAMQGRT